MKLRAAPQALAGAALGLALLTSACGSEEPAPTAELAGRGPEFYAAALASVEKTPELLRDELLKTCDKWRHLDRPCEMEEARRDQLECWVDKGERIHKWVESRELRPRAAILRTLMEVNVCMELKRWRKVRPGPDLDAQK